VNELTAQRKIFADAIVEGKPRDEAMQLAYPDAKPKSRRTMAAALMNDPDVMEYIVLRRGTDAIFTKEYLLLRLKQVIDDPEATATARVQAIRAAGEISGVIAVGAQHKPKPKTLAEQEGLPAEIRDLAERAREYTGRPS
jgi:phage terminase small subunit